MMELYQISQLIHRILSQQLRIGMGIDFHSLHEGYPLSREVSASC